MAALPAGTVTFLFTDIEGSTRLAERHRQAMPAAQARHDALLRALHAEDWGGVGLDAPLRVRMALHTGAAELREDDYFGLPLNRVARLRDSGHGGQVLLSQAAAELVRDGLPEGVSLHDLGEHRLRDLFRPERIYHVVATGLPADLPPLRTLDTLPHNLPRQLTSFIGREQEVAELVELLGSTQLLTLTGPGGNGKTRLALQVAAGVMADHADGVWLVELAPIADPSLVPQMVASVLGVREPAGRPWVDTLRQALQPKQLLLVLDNCEHLVDACAALADRLLRICPGVRMLATSREALRIAGERSWRVPALALPPEGRRSADQPLSPDVAAQYAAVQLFVDRALAVAPAFRLTAQNAAAVAQICRRLDGIPLAIELAAARVRILPPEHLLARLEDRFRLLTGGSRTALERQQTLRAAVDWSYDLLAEPERRLFHRLSVFVGGWTTEAAEAVCSGDGIASEDVLHLLTHLADKSLVVVEEPGDGTARSRLLETLRQYGRQRLLGSGYATAVHERHAAYYLSLAEQVGGPHVEIPASWLDMMEPEQDNVRAALRWLIEHGPHDAALRLAYRAARLWTFRGSMTEGLARLREVLVLPGAAAPNADRAFALFWASTFARYTGDLAAARALAEESLACANAIGDQRGCAFATSIIGLVAREEGAYEAARAWYERALALHREVGDEGGAASQLDRMAQAVYGLGDAGEARRLHEEALAIRRRLGDEWGLAWSLAHLGDLAADRGEYDLARSLYAESLTVHRRLRYSPLLAEALEGLAAFAAVDSDGERALRLLGVAAMVHETAGARMPREDQERVRRITERVRACVSPDVADAAWNAGRAMPLEEALAYALQEQC